jgi:hypothetical protein
MKNVGGRPTIFGSKRGGQRIQGTLTRDGARLFEGARRTLRRLAGVRAPSDADTVEFLARGPEATREYLERK